MQESVLPRKATEMIQPLLNVLMILLSKPFSGGNLNVVLAVAYTALLIIIIKRWRIINRLQRTYLYKGYIVT